MRPALRERRTKLNLTQQQVADRAKIARSSYVNIENGTRNPSLSVALRIKNALECQEDSIFLISDSP